MENNLPNFLIVGATKSGTTSLYHYLKQHREIYMSPAKEPHFLICHTLEFVHRGVGDGFIDRSLIVKDFKEYKKLFSGVKNETRIGEASTGYLYYYETAIPQIKRILGDKRIIIILRNPIDRAYSAYIHMIRENREHLSFEDALREEEKRIKNNWFLLWHYTKQGFYYKQVKAYFENFSAVKLYLLEDLEKNPLRLLKDIYSFLGIDSSFVPDFSTRYNVSGIAKYKLVHNVLLRPNPIKSLSKLILKTLIGNERKVAIGQKLRSNLLKKPAMKTDTREYLKKVFREDILALQDLINRDLSHWLK